MEQWVIAIQAQIKLAKENRNISELNTSIALKEKDMAYHDRKLIQKIFNVNNVIFNPVQPILLDYINDGIITELLPHLTKYLSLVKEKDYHRHAFAKAQEIVNKIQAHLENLKSL